MRRTSDSVNIVYFEIFFLSGQISQFMTEFKRCQNRIDRRQADVTLARQTTVSIQARLRVSQRIELELILTLLTLAVVIVRLSDSVAVAQ